MDVDGFDCLTQMPKWMWTVVLSGIAILKVIQSKCFIFKWYGKTEEEIIYEHTKVEVVSMNVSACTALQSCQVFEECTCFIFTYISSEKQTNKQNNIKRNVTSINVLTVLITVCANSLLESNEEGSGF